MSGTNSVVRGSYDIAVSKISVQDSDGTHITHDIADIADWNRIDRNDILELFLLVFFGRGIGLPQLFQRPPFIPRRPTLPAIIVLEEIIKTWGIIRKPLISILFLLLRVIGIRLRFSFDIQAVFKRYSEEPKTTRNDRPFVPRFKGELLIKPGFARQSPAILWLHQFDTKLRKVRVCRAVNNSGGVYETHSSFGYVTGELELEMSTVLWKRKRPPTFKSRQGDVYVKLGEELETTETEKG
ncbi:hypothetical protein ARMGADRAFT_1064702 [Armillaria gallica]|uniref:Uncharacterized protein n=1 Tax=Armillaria gallica TaxID=47427 RepID=A0A2H3D7W6_ARMGA|nr:hypothetical protein ARMGADRAFT_1064702 [Armillaria gallica]